MSRAEAAPAHAVGALFCSKQCGVSFGAFCFSLQSSAFLSLPLCFPLRGVFLFGVTPSRWAIPVRKALLIIPADLGVNVRGDETEAREKGAVCKPCSVFQLWTRFSKEDAGTRQELLWVLSGAGLSTDTTQASGRSRPFAAAPRCDRSRRGFGGSGVGPPRRSPAACVGGEEQVHSTSEARVVVYLISRRLKTNKKLL